MTITTLCLAALALLWSIWNHRRISVLKEDLRYVHRSTRIRLDEAEETARKQDAKIRDLIASSPAATEEAKGSWFSRHMTIQDAINLHPGVKDVLASMHIGGCSSCSVSAKETLEQAAEGHSVDLQAMLAGMNALMEGQPPPTQAEPEKPDELAIAEKALPPANGGRVMLAAVKPTKDTPENTIT